MPALATTLLDAVKTAVTALALPGVAKVIVRRDSKHNPLFAPGDEPFPLVVITSNEGQKLKGGTAAKVFCEYLVTVHYLFKELPGDRGESDAVRAAQEAVRKRFDLGGWVVVRAVNRIDPQVLPPFTLPFKDATVSDAAVQLRVQTFEPRN
ncbi:hypothetical protein [Gemmata sp.]|uniref:hypothetical protein n=1 Tax=Gemmata sp. TaxID=1914242 RepID=UPI003F72FDCB